MRKNSKYNSKIFSHDFPNSDLRLEYTFRFIDSRCENPPIYEAKVISENLNNKFLESWGFEGVINHLLWHVSLVCTDAKEMISFAIATPSLWVYGRYAIELRVLWLSTEFERLWQTVGAGIFVSLAFMIGASRSSSLSTIFQDIYPFCLRVLHESLSSGKIPLSNYCFICELYCRRKKRNEISKSFQR